jgi:hypothetical protein
MPENQMYHLFIVFTCDGAIRFIVKYSAFIFCRVRTGRLVCSSYFKTNVQNLKTLSHRVILALPCQGTCFLYSEDVFRFRMLFSEMTGSHVM